MVETDGGNARTQVQALPKLGRGMMFDRYLAVVSRLQDAAAVRMPYGFDKEDCFRTAWITGGASGGDCWGRAEYEVEPEGERALEVLLDMIEYLDVKLTEANAIYDLVETGSESETGFYGNWTEYRWKAVSFVAVYDKLVEFGYAEPRPAMVPAP